jgi:mRNA interferase MazF
VRRGEIRRVDFEPARGSEVDKRRPAVIVSNEGANRAVAHINRGVLTVVPLTSNVGHVEPFQLLVPASESGLSEDSKAQTEQIRAVDVSRVGPVLGSIPHELMRDLDVALRIQLVL